MAINLGLQCVGLMRDKMSEEHEKAIEHCNTLAQLCKIGEKRQIP